MEIRDFNFEGVDYKAELRDEADASVWAEIFKLREYRIAEEILKNCKDPILDVGAHIGLFTIYARAFNAKAKIFALEPESKNFAALNEHIEVNKIKGVTAVKAALTDRTGTGELQISKDSHNHTLFATTAVDQTQIEEVPVFTFHDFCEEYKIKNVGLMKMDIEGGEYAVFDAFADEDYAKLSALVMEYHNYGGQNFKKIEQKLREHGFKVQIFPSKFDKQMGFIFAVNKRK